MLWSSEHLTRKRPQRNNYTTFKIDAFSNDKPIPTQGKSSLNLLPNDFSQKLQKFMAVNKKHQSDQVCVCEDCIYAKQLNRYEALKMDLSKRSSYQLQYNKRNLKKNPGKTQNLDESSFSSKPQEGNMSKGPYVHLGSVYKNSYASRSLQKVEKPRPTDELKFQGPSTSFSSYKQMYSNINAPSQYIEPIKHEILPPIKFHAESIYSNVFKAAKTVETESGKINDCIKLGKPLMVKESTTKSQYVNPEMYSLKNERYNVGTQSRSRIPNSNFSFQYKTVSQDEYDKPVQKKNCRNKRLHHFHGQLLANQNISTID